MGGLRGEQLFYQELCEFYENNNCGKLLIKKLFENIERGEIDAYFENLLLAVLYNTFNMADQYMVILKPPPDDIRLTALHMRGYRGREADELLGLENTFHRRANDKLRVLSLSEAIMVSALLEMSVMLCLDGQLIPADDAAWFQHLGTESFDKLKNMYIYLSGREAPRIFLYGRLRADDVIDEPDAWDYVDSIGMTLVSTSNFCELSITVDRSLPGRIAMWERYLSEIAERLGILEWEFPYVYTGANVLGSSNNIEVHRLTWLKNSIPRARATLYANVFSSRTFVIGTTNRWCLHPVNNWDAALDLLASTTFARTPDLPWKVNHRG